MAGNGTRQRETFDVVVVGAGPAGAEAALAAAGSGAHTLCLTINLDTAGFPPATPILADGADDRRRHLLKEVEVMGGRLPALLSGEGAAHELPGGRLITDRRVLGLAYKQALEEADGLYLRQSLVTSVTPAGDGWTVQTALGEALGARKVVLAAGTYCDARVESGGPTRSGGRRGEIAAIALSRCLDSLGIDMERVRAYTSCRLGRSSPSPADSFPQGLEPVPDGSQLGELFCFGFEEEGSAFAQLSSLRSHPSLAASWISRPAWSVSHLCLSAGQLDTDLQSPAYPGLFAAGRFAGSCNYVEAAALGLLAGANASASALGRPSVKLMDSKKFVNKLRKRISSTKLRPVTIRIDGAGC